MKQHRKAAYEEEMRKMAEVKRAYESLEDGQRGPRISLANTRFELYCMEYFDYFYDSDCVYDQLIKHVEFQHHHGNRKAGLPPAGLRRVDGKVHLESYGEPTFQPFVVPAYASREIGRLVSPWGNQEEMSVQFLSDDHLILKLSQRAVFEPDNAPLDLPEVFVFFGVRDREEEALEKERQERASRQSPRETWFEMNHPMGWWSKTHSWF
ncbi:hypothetical protein BO78DRAFT_412552 [Aspergillus sclerotiicarbonarius CBS 121057]|uniref:Uncharacterized protein n=1 Tax=Aspergillus sclerotiicarbonarius (strain CBS 121057 / IBT 28362) TaxID=1448318 RepID=A0A319FNZ9_ASPSB|nr:hypothetical protein BO78DRAFT_412552 [Aspergillus sclerotiicarbonarius CBS 121057]